MSNMMERIAQRWADRPRTRIVIPEIPDENGEPTVWYSKPFTLYDKQQMAHYLDKESPDADVELIVRKAEDEEGNRLFDKGDKPKLKRLLEYHILSRVALEIYSSDLTEDPLKNS